MTDIWAFGVTVWETITRQRPYPGKDSIQVAFEVARAGLTLPIPIENCPPIFAQLMRSCFEREPSSRPTFAMICHILENVDSNSLRYTPIYIFTYPSLSPHSFCPYFYLV